MNRVCHQFWHTFCQKNCPKFCSRFLRDFPLTNQQLEILEHANKNANKNTSIATAPQQHLPDWFYPLYILSASVVVTYLINLNCPEFQEKISKLPQNTTYDEIITLYSDECNNYGDYEYNRCNLWWKSFLLFIGLTPIVRHFTL